MNEFVSRLSGLIARTFVTPVHNRVVAGRRVQQIARHLGTLLPGGTELTGLDVGCGSGELAQLLEQANPALTLSGVDVLVRPDTAIPVTPFDGKQLPFEDNSFDFCLLSDVLHHTEDPVQLIRECKRVSSRFILIKDHRCDSRADEWTLAFMDWVGNRGVGVRLPYNYQSTGQWGTIFRHCGLTVECSVDRLELYPFPFGYLFDRRLHFAARCTEDSSRQART